MPRPSSVAARWVRTGYTDAAQGQPMARLGIAQLHAERWYLYGYVAGAVALEFGIDLLSARESKP